jgi:hypothetical protein
MCVGTSLPVGTAREARSIACLLARVLWRQMALGCDKLPRAHLPSGAWRRKPSGAGVARRPPRAVQEGPMGNLGVRCGRVAPLGSGAEWGRFMPYHPRPASASPGRTSLVAHRMRGSYAHWSRTSPGGVRDPARQEALPKEGMLVPEAPPVARRDTFSLSLPPIGARGTRAGLARQLDRAQECLKRSLALVQSAQMVLCEAEKRVRRMPRWPPSLDA